VALVGFEQTPFSLWWIKMQGKWRKIMFFTSYINQNQYFVTADK
jgi:hypothetical protein